MSEKVRVGGLYVTRKEDGSYTALKVLKTDDGGVHVRLYSNKYPNRPNSIDESELYIAGFDRKPGEELGMGHAPVSWDSFRKWRAEFVQQSTVTDKELEGYKIWREAGGGYF